MTVVDSTRTRTRRRTSGWGGRALVVPAAVTVVVLTVLPLLFIIRISFAEADAYGGVDGGFTLENYLKLWDAAYIKTFAYSFGLAGINTVVCLVVGYFTAYYIASQTLAKQNLLLLLVIVPFWIDFLVRTFAWITILGTGGPIAGALGLFGLEGFSLIPSNVAVVIGMLYSFLPLAVFPIYASMRNIDPSIIEAAKDLGCSHVAVHRRVILPLSLPGILGAATLTFIPTMGVFVIPVLLGGGKDLLVGNLIVMLYTEFRNQPTGAAISVVLLVLMLFSMYLVAIVLKRQQRSSK